jgi:Ca2+-binding RTX toxin-like protein
LNLAYGSRRPLSDVAAQQSGANEENGKMAGVSVLGGAGETVTLPFPVGQLATIAQSFADKLTGQIRSGALRAVNYIGGPLPSVPPGQDEEVVIQASGGLALPKQVTAVINLAQSAVVFGGGAPDETILSGAGNFTFFTNGGSGAIVSAGPSRIVQSGAGPWNINTGDGDDTIVINGGVNTISAGTGSNSILLNGGANLVNATGDDIIQAVQGTDTITATGDGPIRIEGVKAKLTFVGGDGPSTVVGGQGAVTVFASSGGYFKGGTAGNNLILGGDGPTTITGGGNGDQLFATGSFATEIYAAGGNETLDSSLSRANDLLQGGSGKNQMIGGFGNDTLIAGTGGATMQGGTGQDLFKFIQGQTSSVLIVDFSAIEGDKVGLVGYGRNEIAGALENAQHTAAGTTLTLSDDTKITFVNVSGLSKANFS